MHEIGSVREGVRSPKSDTQEDDDSCFRIEQMGKELVKNAQGKSRRRLARGSALDSAASAASEIYKSADKKLRSELDSGDLAIHCRSSCCVQRANTKGKQQRQPQSHNKSACVTRAESRRAVL